MAGVASASFKPVGVGWGASALVYTGLYAFLPEEIAWRALFAIGLLPAVFVFWIRRHIDEPEIFRSSQRTRPAVGVAHLFSAFSGPHFWSHSQGVADGRRRAGRRLCPGDLDADLAARGARFVRDRYRRVPVDTDLWCA